MVSPEGPTASTCLGLPNRRPMPAAMTTRVGPWTGAVGPRSSTQPVARQPRRRSFGCPPCSPEESVTAPWYSPISPTSGSRSDPLQAVEAMGELVGETVDVALDEVRYTQAGVLDQWREIHGEDHAGRHVDIMRSVVGRIRPPPAHGGKVIALAAGDLRVE